MAMATTAGAVSTYDLEKEETRSDRGGDYKGDRDDVLPGGQQEGDKVRSRWRIPQVQGKHTS